MPRSRAAERPFGVRLKKRDKKPLSSVQRATEELRRRIFSGEFPPGSDHLESELSEALGMSRTPVREAALLLESRGLIELRPRKGVRILPISAKDMSEIYDILTELETMSARLAALRPTTSADLAPLAVSLSDMETALARGSLEDWAVADQVFHKALVDIGGNHRARKIFDTMSDQVRRARAVTLRLRPMPLQSNDDHGRVFQAIAGGDADTAARVHRGHRTAAKELMLGLLVKHNLGRL